MIESTEDTDPSRDFFGTVFLKNKNRVHFLAPKIFRKKSGSFFWNRFLKIEKTVLFSPGTDS
jgi:hypothetical protein